MKNLTQVSVNHGLYSIYMDYNPCICHAWSIIKHGIYMDYLRTMEGLECFSNAFARCSKHLVGGWTFLYHLVQNRRSWEFLMVMNKAVFSLFLNY